MHLNHLVGLQVVSCGTSIKQCSRRFGGSPIFETCLCESGYDVIYIYIFILLCIVGVKKYNNIFTHQFPWKPKSSTYGFAPVEHVVFYRFLCCCMAGFQPNKRLSCCWQDCRQVLSSTERGDMGLYWLYVTYNIDSTRITNLTSIQVWHQHSNVKSSSRPCWEVLPYLLHYTYYMVGFCWYKP